MSGLTVAASAELVGLLEGFAGYVPRLYPKPGVETVESLRKDLRRALDLTAQAGAARSTDCTWHPFGAVDPEALDRCLLCEQRRRAAHGRTGTPPDWRKLLAAKPSHRHRALTARSPGVEPW